MTAIWMGIATVDSERSRIALDGSRTLAATMQVWLGLSPFAAQQKLVGTLPPEFNDTIHDKGIVSMARGEDPASASTSFFIVTARASLDGSTAFARVVDGMSVVEAIEQVPRTRRRTRVEPRQTRVISRPEQRVPPEVRARQGDSGGELPSPCQRVSRQRGRIPNPESRIPRDEAIIRPNPPEVCMDHEDKDKPAAATGGVSRRGFITSVGSGAIGVAAAGALVHGAPPQAQAEAVKAGDVSPSLTVNGALKMLVEAAGRCCASCAITLGWRGTKSGASGECGAYGTHRRQARYACMTLAVRRTTRDYDGRGLMTERSWPTSARSPRKTRSSAGTALPAR
jgi:hypothetical protein